MTCNMIHIAGIDVSEKVKRPGRSVGTGIDPDERVIPKGKGQGVRIVWRFCG